MARVGGKYDKILAALVASDDKKIKVSRTSTSNTTIKTLAQQVRTGIKSSVSRYNRMSRELGQSELADTIGVRVISDTELVIELKPKPTDSDTFVICDNVS